MKTNKRKILKYFCCCHLRIASFSMLLLRLGIWLELYYVYLFHFSNLFSVLIWLKLYVLAFNIWTSLFVTYLMVVVFRDWYFIS